jgi:hypothetical protein
MRPNIEISHQLNGRVKDYAAASDQTTSEAYREIIKAGLAAVESQTEAKPDATMTDDSPEIVVPESVPERIDNDDARAAIAATLELVASNGGVQRAEIIEQIAPEHPLDYDDIGARGAWWRKVIRPALEETCRFDNGVGWVQADEQ